MNKNDYKLLNVALNSNDFGVDYECYYEDTVKRLLKKFLIQWKPSQLKSNIHSRLLIITLTGKEALKTHIIDESKDES